MARRKTPPPEPPEEPMWTLQQTALYLNRPEGTLYQWIHRGYGPPSYKMGNARMYDPAEVREWKLSCRTAGAA